jgi:hypothetical protein
MTALYLDSLETLLIARLESKLLAVNGGPLRFIHVRTFQGEEQIEAVLTRYQDQLPGGFLSEPILDYKPENRPAGLTRRIEFDANYSFVAVSSTREDHDARKGFSHDTVQRFNDALVGIWLDPSSLGSGFGLEQVLVRSSNVLDLPAFYARGFAFDIRVRGECENADP